MRGFVLAAGFGTRLRPLTEHIPKALVPVCGEPLLKRSLDLLHKNGIDEIAANAHYLAEQIYDFRNSSGYEFEIFHEEGKIRGTGGAFPFAKSFLQEDDSFCVVNADIVTNVNIKKIAEKFIASDSICTLVAAPAKDNGSILMNKENGVYCGIANREDSLKSALAVDFIGLTFYKKEFLEQITEDDFSIVPVWTRLQQKGFNVNVELDTDLYWQDTGTPQQFVKVHQDMLNCKIDLEIPPHINVYKAVPAAVADTHGDTLIQKIQGLCWVGNTDLSKVTTIRDSIIFDNAKVNGRSVLENTIVTPWGDIALNE